MAKPRNIEDGRLRCSKCPNMQPVNSFTVDRRAQTGRGQICRWCREKKRKTIVVDPDYQVVSVNRVEVKKPRSRETYAHGSWDRLVLHVRLLTDIEVIKLNIGRGYYTHHSARTAISKAAARIKLKVYMLHDATCIYVRPLKSNGWT